MQATLTPAPVAARESVRGPQAVPRNIAVDAYRGFVMLLMMAEVLELARVAHAFPGNWFWAFLGYNQTHVAWAGCSLHDMIQPSFSFLVGVALPYSIASRVAKGGTFGKMWAHAIWRSFLLIALGIFLRSMNSTQTYFTFEDTLTQIGLGYPLLFCWASVRRAGSGSRWGRCSPAIGWRGLCTRCRGRIQLAVRGCTGRLASFLYGLRRALE